MMGVNKIIFNHYGIITLFVDEGIIKSNNIDKKISNDKLMDILKNIVMITHNWESEYIDLNTYDGVDWSLDIYYSDGEIQTYKGHASYPDNFNKLDNLFTNLLKEVL